MIIGLCGYAGAGKDTAASFLEGFERRAFADKLKELAYEIDDDIRWAVDAFGWDAAKRFPALRKYLQDLGQSHRKVFGDDFWIKAAFPEVFGSDYEGSGIDDYFFEDNDIVVTDVRYPNEAEFIKGCAGKLFLIHRPGVEAPNDHISEQIDRLAPYVDVTILNPPGMVESLQTSINFWAAMYKED